MRRRPRWVEVLGELAEWLTKPLQLSLIAVGVLSAIFGELRDASQASGDAVRSSCV